MSTEKEKCNGTKAEWLLEFEKMVKDNSFVTPSSHLNVLAIQDFISKAIASAVEASGNEFRKTLNSGRKMYEIGKKDERERIKSDLLKVADEIEGEELRSEVERYFKTIL